MSLSIGWSAPSAQVAGSAGVTAGPVVEDEQGGVLTALSTVSDGAPAGKKKSSGQVVDTLVDRLAELHDRLQRLRRELRAAIRSPQPDVVRLPRILSLQRQILVTNSDIQLVSGLLFSTLSKSISTIRAQG